MSLRPRAAAPSVAKLPSSLPPSRHPPATGAHYTNVRKFPSGSSRAGLPYDVYGIVIKAPSRTDVIVGQYEPLVRAVGILVGKCYDRLRRYGPRKGIAVAQGHWDAYGWTTMPKKFDFPIVENQKEGAINFRAKITAHVGLEGVDIKMKITAVMDGPGRTTPWEVFLLAPTAPSVDLMFPPVPHPMTGGV